MIHAWIVMDSALQQEFIIIAVMGYIVVFAALVLLFLFFNMLPRLIHMDGWKRLFIRGKEVQKKIEPDIQGETTAAISMAIYLYLSELHDDESGILTIKKVSKTYSPWSSKIYAVRNQFNRR
ncbi:MAG: OadG family protein [Bacteroidales bacterium]|nr:OadG family protein [Bacteroidales bacterium]